MRIKTLLIVAHAPPANTRALRDAAPGVSVELRPESKYARAALEYSPALTAEGAAAQMEARLPPQLLG